VNPRQVNQSLRPLIDANAQRAAQANTAVASIELLATIMNNRAQGGTSSGSGQSSTATLPAITQTPNTSGSSFEVSAYGNVATSSPGDPVSATLIRGGSPLGPTVNFHTDASGNFPLSVGPFVDADPAHGSYVYGVQVTNLTSGHTVEFSSVNAVAQEIV
jgi:hypothetical protein